MQTLMSVGAVSASTATDLFNDCLSKSGSTYRVDTDDLGDAVESLNNSLRAFDFQVDATVCSDGDVWWGFVNTARDDAAKLACAFTSTQRHRRSDQHGIAVGRGQQNACIGRKQNNPEIGAAAMAQYR